MIQEETLYYTYLDECKRNYLSDVVKKHTSEKFEEYSITSITFEQNYYKNEFEPLWIQFRKKYNIDGYKAMHFVEYKKLINPDEQNEENIGYSTFLDENKNFSIQLLKNFFNDLKNLLDSADFFIVHTDFYWKQQQYLIKRNKLNNVELKKKTRNIAPRILNAVPYLAMRKQLDSLMLSLLKQNIDGKLFLDEELPKKVNTKLRFDADGKEFDARNDLKKAYNHTITMGSDTVNSVTATEILDEIRFIRKEEVGHEYVPNHCGLEIVDMLCSMIAGETRLMEYKKILDIPECEELTEGNFINLKFEDNEIIEFNSLLQKKMIANSISYCPF